MQIEKFFFHDWTGLLRVVVVGVLAYLAMVCLLRIMGKRTLAKMNAFDFVVTIALGSILGTILLNKSVPVAEGVLAFALLMGLQYTLAWITSRWDHADTIVKSDPRLMLYRGKLLHEELRAERVSQSEIYAAIRTHGYASPEQVHAVVLETDGSFSVIGGQQDQPANSLRFVHGGDLKGRTGTS